MVQQKYRTEAREKITLLLAELIDEDSDINIDSVSTTIEKGINNYAFQHAKNQNILTNWQIPEFVAIYEAQFHTIMFNLENSDTLLAEIGNGHYNIGKYTPEKLNPIANAKIRKEISDRENVNVEYKVSDRHQCRKCKQRRIAIRDYQARGSDEPRTIVAECLDCGTRWNIQ